MNQDRRVASKFTREELKRIIPPIDIQLQVVAELVFMNFLPVDEAENPIVTGAPIEVDNNNGSNSEYDKISPAGELTNAITAFGQWFGDNNIADNEHPGLIENIRRLAMMFSLIPAPHHCPPPPCVCPHQDSAPPCPHLHAEDVPPPLPCQHPHCNDEDIPMEPPAPTCVYSEAALQTPAPSHEASMPPPPLAAVATLPAAVASISTASPHG
ncbi:hypothetical protein P691DRAFT_766333 [Macrolepiota fuliginosa MF-IS2]|uniref:Uncharacterized protein n=1 Tax=Macrolepiota fuliginosa MF-IS2 TaxID=1400762 RepID=A0A9P6BXD2_9AGAR|nr:hypothetical protein P691DRAFT_766333 [Macrolepiota fuliginosa MF-IS2]